MAVTEATHNNSNTATETPLTVDSNNNNNSTHLPLLVPATAALILEEARAVHHTLGSSRITPADPIEMLNRFD